jgi:hypothetical protein
MRDVLIIDQPVSLSLAELGIKALAANCHWTQRKVASLDGSWFQEKIEELG